jgi:hypothetical protein
VGVDDYRKKQRKKAGPNDRAFVLHCVKGNFFNFFSSYFLSCFSTSLFQVFPEAESVWVAEPEVFALVFAVAELSPEVVVLVVEPEVFALVFVVAELSPEVVVLVVEPEVVSVVEL